METKPLPASEEIEKAVLGELLLGNDPEGFQDLDEPLFHTRANKIVFRAILSAKKANLAIDPIVITSKLKDEGVLGEVGGASYISALPFSACSTSPLQYVNILKEKHRIRKLVDLTSSAQIDCFGSKTSEEIIAGLGEALIALQGDESKGNMTIESCDEVSGLIDRKISGEVVSGIRTTIECWDKVLGGLLERYYVIAARAKVGKTVLMEHLIDSMAKQGLPSLVFEKDMHPTMLILRMACRRANVAFYKVDLGKASRDEYLRVKAEVEVLKHSPIYIYSPSGMTVSKMLSIIKIEHRIHGIKGVFLDHILNLDVGSDLRTGMTLASSRIRDSVQETRIPHVILAQLNRGAHNYERPTAAHIKEFDGLYADCDVMAMLWSEKDPIDVPNNELFPLKFTCNKNRGGTEFEEEIGFDRPTMKLKTMAKNV